jgi:hypothetical protein
MIRCPNCSSPRVILVLSRRHARCLRCGATWVQDGPYQDRVRTVDSRPDALEETLSSP